MIEKLDRRTHMFINLSVALSLDLTNVIQVWARARWAWRLLESTDVRLTVCTVEIIAFHRAAEVSSPLVNDRAAEQVTQSS